MSLPQNIIKASEKQGETNDCSVKAVAIVTGKPYKAAHKVLNALGRVNGKGCTVGIINEAIRHLGGKLELSSDRFKAKTITSLKKELPKRGIFLVYTRNHVVACRGGEVLDWTENRRNRITSVYKVKMG